MANFGIQRSLRCMILGVIDPAGAAAASGGTSNPCRGVARLPRRLRRGRAEECSWGSEKGQACGAKKGGSDLVIFDMA